MTAQGGLKILPVVQAVILLVLALSGLFAGPVAAAFLTVYGRGLASLALGLFIVATASSMPFTTQFARAARPPSEWNSPVFLQVNRQISLAWGYVVLIVGTCHIIGAYLESQHVHPLLRLLVDWGVPILAVVRVIADTRRIADKASHSEQDSHERTNSCPQPTRH